MKKFPEQHNLENKYVTLIKETSAKIGDQTGLYGGALIPCHTYIANYSKQEETYTCSTHLWQEGVAHLTIQQEEENSLSKDSPANQRL